MNGTGTMILISITTFVISVGVTVFISGWRMGTMQATIASIDDRLERIEDLFTLKLRREVRQHESRSNRNTRPVGRNGGNNSSSGSLRVLPRMALGYPGNRCASRTRLSRGSHSTTEDSATHHASGYR